MPIKIYTIKEGKRTAITASLQDVVKINDNIQAQANLLVKYSECETDASDCTPLYEIMQPLSEVFIKTDKGNAHAICFNDTNTNEIAYLDLAGDLFPFAFVNYEWHKQLCTDFDEAVPTIAQYIRLLFEPIAIKANAFVVLDDAKIEFFNGIPAQADSPDSDIEEIMEDEAEEREEQEEEEEEENE